MAKLDGSVYQSKIAAFRVIPYYARRSITLPDLPGSGFDVDDEKIKELEDSEEDGAAQKVDFNFHQMPALRLQLDGNK